ncbi:HNH endonuclease [Halorussus marinus]|uniref:HNH endonuclease n=1 Tax=Halorussus marinus TaxID=2505976 RepID=UPI00143D8198|nr:HNH endonuclease [Halorussus marinus]
MADPYADADTPWRNPQILRNLFVEQGLNTAEIAEELGASDTTVQKWLDEHGIKKKETINKDRPWRDEELVRELYHNQQLTIPELADELECGYATAHEWIHKHEIETRGKYEESRRVRRRNPPGHRITKSGYEVVETTISGSTREVRIHRLVVVAEQGFEALNGKIVHHRNGIPWDNRPENLEIMSNEEHAKVHRPVEVRWGHRSPRDAHKGADTDA